MKQNLSVFAEFALPEIYLGKFSRDLRTCLRFRNLIDELICCVSVSRVQFLENHDQVIERLHLEMDAGFAIINMTCDVLINIAA